MSETLAQSESSDLKIFLQLIGQQIQNTFPNEFSSLYSIGSLAHGDYIPQWSDLNVVTIFKQSVDPKKILSIRQNLWRSNPKLGSQLQLHWSDELLVSGNFPFYDRIDFFDNGKLLAGSTHQVPYYLRPQQQQIQDHIRMNSLPHWQNMAKHYSELYKVDPFDRGYLHSLLMPTRLHSIFHGGKVLSWNASTNFLFDKCTDQQIDKSVFTLALNYRLSRVTFNKISPLRKKLPEIYNQLASLL